MKVEHLFYAVEVADTASFTQAAKNLYISQPNLSYAIKQLEHSLGFSLFERNAKGVVPTKRGLEALEHFRILRKEYEQILSFLNRSEKSTHLHLNVATLNINRTSVAFTEMIRAYIHLPIQFSFSTCGYLEELIPLVETAQVDFGILGTLSPFQKQAISILSQHGITYHPFGTAPVCALLGPHHPLYDQTGGIPLESLYPYTIVQYGSPDKDPHYNVPYALGLTDRCKGAIHVSSSQMFYPTIEMTSAVGLVCANASTFHQYNHYSSLRLIPITNCNILAHYGYIKASFLELSPLATELIHRLQHLF